MIVAKESAAAITHSEEYPAYTALLGVNTTDLSGLLGRAFGATAATQFTRAWDSQNGLLVDYAIDMASHDDDKAKATAAGLTGTFANQFGVMVEAATGIPANGIHDIAYQQVLLDKAFIDDVTAQKYAAFYTDVDKAYAHTSQLGDALARHATATFADRFPGDPSTHTVEARVAVNLLLQERSYLTTMATDAAIAKREADRSAAVAALATSSKQLDKAWADWDVGLLAYASGADLQVPIFVDRLVSATGAPKSAITYYAKATVKVVDDQRSKSSKTLAGDDRAAATATQAVADSL